MRDTAIGKTVLAVPVTVGVLAVEPLSPAVRLAVTALLAASMGLQLALIRYVKVPDLPTAVLTLTAIGVLTERGSGRHDPLVLRRVLAVLAFVVGVVAGRAARAPRGAGGRTDPRSLIILAVGVASHRVSRRTRRPGPRLGDDRPPERSSDRSEIVTPCEKQGGREP